MPSVIDFVNIILISSAILIFIKFTPSRSIGDNERIVGFYLIFTNLTILILVNAIDKFNNILDIVLLLLLLQLASLMLLLTKEK